MTTYYWYNGKRYITHTLLSDCDVIYALCLKFFPDNFHATIEVSKNSKFNLLSNDIRLI